MPFPAPSVSAPTLTSDQIQFQGLVMGPGTPFGIKSLEGLGKADVRSGNTDRPRTRGAFVGTNLLKSRTITATVDVGPFTGPVAQLTNLVPNPSFEYDTAGNAPAAWMSTAVAGNSLNSGSTLTVNPAGGQQGSQYMNVVTTAASNAQGASIFCPGVPSGNFLAGQPYTARVWMIGAAGGEQVQLVLGSTLDDDAIASVTLTTGWTLYTVTWTPSANRSGATHGLAIRTQNATAVTFRVDGAMVVAGATVPSYFDGDTPGYQWSGTPGNSTSIPVPGYGTFGKYGTGQAGFTGALAALRAALATEGSTEFPLYLQLPGFPLLVCEARVLKADVKYDIAADLGSLLQDIPIQFEATDPYFYSTPTGSPSVALPGPSGGFHFPLTFNLSFGGSSTANQVSVTNNGDVTSWPVLQINGPCLNPSVQNQSVAGSPTISLNIQLNAGDQLYLDCDFGSITYFPSGSSAGSPVPQILNAGSTIFGLQPGTNMLTFNSQDTSATTGTLNVWNASAYSGLLG